MTGLAALGVHLDQVLYYAAAGLVALVFHEFAHAFVATRLGDITPRGMGRLTLDPRPHVDTFGTLVLPAILLLIIFFAGPGVFFAYAKPMPFNPWHSRRATRDTVLIQAAGPVTNLILAFVFGAIYRVTCSVPGFNQLILACVGVNVTFAAIHIIPIPPLDGARAIAPFLPYRARETFVNLEQYAPLFMIAVFFLLGQFFFNIVGGIGGGIIRLINLQCG